MKLKQNHAITLIALIITIVVLIILAGVAINIALGENGIYTKSKQAADTYQNAAANEIAELDKTLDVVESLDKNSLAANVKVGDYVAYTPKAGETITIGQGSYNGSTDSNYATALTIAEDGTPTAAGVFGSGSTDGDQTFTVPTDTSTIKWRVLSVEDGCVNLISEKEIGRTGLWTGDSSDTLRLENITGYVYGPEVLNTVSSIYATGTGAKSGRGVTIEDINKITGYNVVNDSSYNTEYGNTFGWDSNHRWKYTYYFYSYNENGLNLATADTTSTVYDLVFGNTAQSGESKSDYWLASRLVDSNSSYAHFNMHFVDGGDLDNNKLYFCSSGEGCASDYERYPVRPVVSLKSSVKLTGGSGTSASPYTFSVE